MVCPFGEECVTSVIDSRKNSEGIRRRRECSTCGLRFTTYEKADITLMGIHYQILKNLPNINS